MHPFFICQDNVVCAVYVGFITSMVFFMTDNPFQTDLDYTMVLSKNGEPFMKKTLQKLSLGLITAVLVSTTFTAVSAQEPTVVEDVIIDQKFANASGRVDSDFFFYQVIITNNGKNNDRHDGFDFNANFYLKPSIEGRHLKYVTNAIDHVYYKKDWYGGSRKAATAMVWDNEEGQWKVPNPWVDIDGNPLDTVTPGNPNGIRLKMTDGGKNALELRPKEDTPIPEVGLSGPFNSLVNNGWNMTEISKNSRKNNVLAYDLYNGETGKVNNGKILEISQEKDESLWPHSHGAWHYFSFGNYIYYEIDNDASITYEPVMINDDYDIGDIVSLRTEASIDAPVSFKLTYQWQISDDNESFVNLEDETLDTLSFEAQKANDGAYYRVVIGVERSNTEVVSNAVKLNINKNLVSYESQLSDVENPDSFYTYKDETLGTLPTLTHPLHQFLGWFYDQDGTKFAQSTDPVTTDTPLYASWDLVEDDELFVDEEISYKVGTVSDEASFLTQIHAHVRRRNARMMIGGIDIDSDIETAVDFNVIGDYDVTVGVTDKVHHTAQDKHVLVHVIHDEPQEQPNTTLPEVEQPVDQKPLIKPQVKPELKPILPETPLVTNPDSEEEGERVENGNVTTEVNTKFVINDESGLIDSEDVPYPTQLPNTGVSSNSNALLGLGITIVGFAVLIYFNRKDR